MSAERLTAAEWYDLPDGSIVHLPAYNVWTTVIIRGGYADVIDAYSDAAVGDHYARTTLAPRDVEDESPRTLVFTPPSLRYRKSQQVVSVWDDSVAPGGYVCSECGAPTESEPCGEHQPERDGECRYHAHTRDGECASGYDDRDDMSSTPGHPTSPEAAS